jgi:hypothetical protein
LRKKFGFIEPSHTERYQTRSVWSNVQAESPGLLAGISGVRLTGKTSIQVGGDEKHGFGGYRLKQPGDIRGSMAKHEDPNNAFSYRSGLLVSLIFAGQFNKEAG